MHIHAYLLAADFLLQHVLAQQREIGLVRGQTEHDQVRVEAVHAVLLIGLVAWLRL